MLVVPGHNGGADRGGERQASEKLIDPVLMDGDIFGTEPVEVLAAVLPVVAEERVTTRWRRSRMVPSISNTMQSCWSG